MQYYLQARARDELLKLSQDGSYSLTDRYLMQELATGQGSVWLDNPLKATYCQDKGYYIPASKTQLICEGLKGHPGDHYQVVKGANGVERLLCWTPKPVKPVLESEVKAVVESLRTIQSALEN